MIRQIADYVQHKAAKKGYDCKRNLDLLIDIPVPGDNETTQQNNTQGKEDRCHGYGKQHDKLPPGAYFFQTGNIMILTYYGSAVNTFFPNLVGHHSLTCPV
jgi:hypothetical protein